MNCMACGKGLEYEFHADAGGVPLVLCGGCAGELGAFIAYGDEAVCEHDWRAIRQRAAGEGAGE